MKYLFSDLAKDTHALYRKPITAKLTKSSSHTTIGERDFRIKGGKAHGINGIRKKMQAVPV